MSKVKSIEKKVTEEQLKTIVDQQNKVGQLLKQIGYVENDKHQLLHEYAGVIQEVEAFKKELENEYGAVNIDIATGVITPIETKEAE
jgi:glycerol kinase